MTSVPTPRSSARTREARVALQPRLACCAVRAQCVQVLTFVRKRERGYDTGQPDRSQPSTPLFRAPRLGAGVGVACTDDRARCHERPRDSSAPVSAHQPRRFLQAARKIPALLLPPPRRCPGRCRRAGSRRVRARVRGLERCSLCELDVALHGCDQRVEERPSPQARPQTCGRCGGARRHERACTSCAGRRPRREVGEGEADESAGAGSGQLAPTHARVPHAACSTRHDDASDCGATRHHRRSREGADSRGSQAAEASARAARLAPEPQLRGRSWTTSRSTNS